MTLRTMIHAVPLAVGALITPLQAASTPQEIFAHLAAPEPQAALSPEKRAAVLPALAYVPAEADLVIATAAPGVASLELMRLLGENPPDDLARGLSSIHDAALVAGAGSAAALERGLPLFTQASQLETMQKCADYWCEHANPAYVATIRTAFQQQIKQGHIGLLADFEQFHLAPIYYAVTAEPGREADFTAMHQQLVKCLRDAAEQDSEIQYEEGSGFSGIRMNWLHAYKWLMKKAPQDTEIAQALAQRELHFITCIRGGIALMILCERPGEVTLPINASYSMLNSPKLSGADAHIDSLLATAWVSTAFNRTMRACMQRNRFPMAQAVVNALQGIGAQDAANQQAYNAAAQDIAWLVWQPSYFNELRTPLTMQVWQQGQQVFVQTVSDAQGMTFEPTKLRLTSQADAPETAFYMESGAFAAPDMPNYTSYWNQTWSSLLGAGKGIALSLREKDRDALSSYIRYIDLFMPEVQALGTAVHTISSGLAAPFSLIAAHDAAAQDTKGGWAFCSAVKNRLALSEGWEQTLNAVGQAAGKMGIPPIVVRALPVSSHTLSDSSASHALLIPFAKGHDLPQVAVSDTYFVLGSSAALNARLLQAATGEVPFQGAVNAIHFPRLAALMKDMPTCCEHQQKLTTMIQRIAERVQSLYSVSTITDNVRTARAMLLLRPTK